MDNKYEKIFTKIFGFAGLIISFNKMVVVNMNGDRSMFYPWGIDVEYPTCSEIGYSIDIINEVADQIFMEDVEHPEKEKARKKGKISGWSPILSCIIYVL